MSKEKKVISVLFIGIIVCALCLFAVKNQILTANEEENIQEYPIIQESDELSEELSYDTQENDEVSEELSTTAQENDEMPEKLTEENAELGNIKSALILENKTYIVLDENGRVWQWQEGETQKDAKLILGTETIVKIMDIGNAAYALTENGDVYAWGDNVIGMINPYEDVGNYPEPVKLEGVSDIVCMDAGYRTAFAVDSTGQFYAWGLGQYSDSRHECTPQVFQGYQDQIGKVEEIYLGGGDFHYFKREDGSFFSITKFYNRASWEGDYIFPSFPDRELITDLHNSSNISEIQGEEKSKISLLYEMGKNDDVKLLAADGYTMYLYLQNNTLWYWNSDRITYHNKEEAGASVEKKDFDHSGYFEQVNLNEVLGIEGDIPEIIQICPSKDEALFLLENGQVLVSEYVTTEVRDVEYYAFDDPIYTPGSSENTAILYQMRLKELSFEKLEYENIISITGNKFRQPCLLDKSGNIYCYAGSVDWQ
ncbi:MAG: hypothetical protein HDR30_00810 [Lachnospiraceae bacterium]|nr:hypothetical protein [Lachnospiraceae bacterium]